MIQTFLIEASLCFKTTSSSLNYQYGISTTLNSFDAGISPYLSKYHIMNFVNEVRTMHCSRVLYCPNTNGNLYVALIYPTGKKLVTCIFE